MTRRRLPLFLIGGPAGAGKSSVREALLGTIDQVVAFESDVLWRAEYERAHEDFFRTWLRLAVDASQSGRPVAIFGAGFAVPRNVESLPERASFDAVHYLALTCDDTTLAARLQSRQAPRCATDAHVDEHVSYNRWLRAKAQTLTPAVTTLDTTTATLEETSAAVAAWLETHLGA